MRVLHEGNSHIPSFFPSHVLCLVELFSQRTWESINDSFTDGRSIQSIFNNHKGVAEVIRNMKDHID